MCLSCPRQRRFREFKTEKTQTPAKVKILKTLQLVVAVGTVQNAEVRFLRTGFLCTRTWKEHKTALTLTKLSKLLEEVVAKQAFGVGATATYARGVHTTSVKCTFYTFSLFPWVDRYPPPNARGNADKLQIFFGKQNEHLRL